MPYGGRPAEPGRRSTSCVARRRGCPDPLRQCVCQPISTPKHWTPELLTIGQMTAALVIHGPTEKERRQQVENVADVPVNPVVRLGLTEARARELIATLGANLDHLETVCKLEPKGTRAR